MTEGSRQIVSQVLQLQAEQPIRAGGARLIVWRGRLRRWAFVGDFFELLDVLPDNVGRDRETEALKARAKARQRFADAP